MAQDKDDERAAPEATILYPAGLSSAEAPAVGAGSGQVAIGSVLNHIYEVKRFIARGGMGEVYEGVNVNTDERVAIKVVLPHMAADPNVHAMFRKEARVLTRLSHPALVQYRVLANEPVLGVLYIVTDYLDGVGLDQLIGKLTLSPAEVLALIKRLAEGLKVAHDLGAIHRDISLDNILVPRERIEAATIIDFGIAKDLEASHATIVGQGFAGKLAFAAPEQFGDFDREIGPWTDIYSLGLVMLAVAGGRAVDMGKTLVEAIDRRRAGPDLSILTPALRPLVARMVAANPKDRFQSMGELLETLAKVKLEGRPPKPEKAAKAPRRAPLPKVEAPARAQVSDQVAAPVPPPEPDTIPAPMAEEPTPPPPPPEPPRPAPLPEAVAPPKAPAPQAWPEAAPVANAAAEDIRPFDLQARSRKREGGSPVLMVVLTLVIAVLLGGGYMAYRLARSAITYSTAEKAASVPDMAALTRKQVMARISVNEPGASLFDWTETGTSASGLSCSVMNRGDMATGWAWTVCGVGERVVRVSVGARQGVISSNSELPAQLMRRMIAAVAPEAPAEHRFEAGDAFNYYWGNHGGVNIGGAAIRFSTDNDGGLTRITATPRV